MQTVGDTVTELQHLREQQRVLSQREALRVWNPMLDRIVALFAATVAGEAPSLGLDADGKPRRRPDGSWPLSGGWPCQQVPAGWQERARACLDDFHRLRGEHRLCGKPDRHKAHLGRLHGFLQRCVSDPRALTGRDVGMIRMILAHIAARRGLPGSPRCSALREEQAHTAALPTKKELSAVVIERLRGKQKEEGLDAIEPLLLPVTAEEAARLCLPAARPLPPGFRAPLLRCLDAPIEQLVELGVVPLGEVLAQVVPQLTAQVGAASVSDLDLRRLHGAIYEAFRRRRSLLLLNLQHQVRLDELPWVLAIAPFRSENASTRAVARTALAGLATLALTAFPQAILPNKLLREVRALSERADLKLPIVDEIAADIFMGEFPTSRAFARLCAEQAGESTEGGGGWGRGRVARNGKIIEQEQILTTHNLAVLVGGLDLGTALSPRFPALARSCFAWICRQQQLPIAAFCPRLRMMKNTAYAWRQMIFYLSMVPGAVSDFLGWANGHLGEQPPGFQERFRPTLSSLARAARGESPEAPPEARRFLGWVSPLPSPGEARPLPLPLK